MRKILIKDLVVFKELNDMTLQILEVVLTTWDWSTGKTPVLTSGNDSKHSENSLHYKNMALDFRTRDLTPDQQMSWTDRMRNSLGNKFDVVLENNHLHVEYDPK